MVHGPPGLQPEKFLWKIFSGLELVCLRTRSAEWVWVWWEAVWAWAATSRGPEYQEGLAGGSSRCVFPGTWHQAPLQQVKMKEPITQIRGNGSTFIKQSLN